MTYRPTYRQKDRQTYGQSDWSGSYKINHDFLKISLLGLMYLLPKPLLYPVPIFRNLIKIIIWFDKILSLKRNHWLKGHIVFFSIINEKILSGIRNYPIRILRILFVNRIFICDVNSCTWIFRCFAYLIHRIKGGII